MKINQKLQYESNKVGNQVENTVWSQVTNTLEKSYPKYVMIFYDTHTSILCYSIEDVNYYLKLYKDIPFVISPIKEVKLFSMYDVINYEKGELKCI